MSSQPERLQHPPRDTRKQRKSKSSKILINSLKQSPQGLARPAPIVRFTGTPPDRLKSALPEQEIVEPPYTKVVQKYINSDINVVKDLYKKIAKSVEVEKLRILSTPKKKR